MAHAPSDRQWTLTSRETIATFEHWKSVMEYSFLSDSTWSDFTSPGATWVCGEDDKTFGLKDDTGSGTDKRTAAVKIAALTRMIEYIAGYAPIVAKSILLREPKSIPEIWQILCDHYGFESFGAHINTLAKVHMEPGEQPNDVYQRIYAIVENNLLKRGSQSKKRTNRTSKTKR